MKLISILISFSLISYSIPAQAIIRGGIAEIAYKGPAKAWRGPLTDSLKSLGHAALTGTGSTSLEFFGRRHEMRSKLNIEEASSYELESLAVAVQNAVVKKLTPNEIHPGQSASEFGALSQDKQREMREKAAIARFNKDGQLDFLKEGALAAEQTAGEEAGKLDSELGEGPFTYADVQKLESRLDDFLHKNAAYVEKGLRDSLLDRLAALGNAHEKHNAEARKFHHELPGKLANGGFDGAIYSKTDEGWVAADVSPFADFESLGAAFAHRIGELNKVPEGPWTGDVRSGMSRALDLASVTDKIDATEPQVDQLRGMLDTIQPEQPKPAFAAAQGGVAQALAEGNLPSAKQIRAVYDHFTDVISKTGGTSLRERAFLALSQGNAEAGLPSWEQLRGWRDARIKRLAFQGAGAKTIAWLALIGSFFLPVIPDMLPGMWDAVVILGISAAAFIAAHYLKEAKASLSKIENRKVGDPIEDFEKRAALRK